MSFPLFSGRFATLIAAAAAAPDEMPTYKGNAVTFVGNEYLIFVSEVKIVSE